MLNSVELLKLHDAYWGSEDAEKQQALMQELIASFEAIQTPTADDTHLMGIMHYMYDHGEKNHHKAEALSLFQQALALDETHFLARLYLAHCYHDQQQFELALKNYLQVDQAAIKDFQKWRYVKLLEQIGYCLWQVSRQEEAMPYFEKVLTYYQHESDDSFAHPQEMEQCLAADHPIIIAIKQTKDYW